MTADEVLAFCFPADLAGGGKGPGTNVLCLASLEVGSHLDLQGR